MAHIQKRAPGRWRARYRDLAGRERSKTFDRRIDAERWLAGVEADLLRGAWVDPRLGRMMFAEHAARVLEAKLNVRPSTKARDESYMRSLILPHFGNRPLASIARRDLQGWVNRLSHNNYAPETVRKAYQLVAAVLGDAENENLIARSPARGVALPAVDRTEMRFLTHNQVEDLAQVIEVDFRAMVHLAAYGGLRFGEIAGLQVQDLDLSHRRVTIRRTASEVRGTVTMGPPKTAAARRPVVLPDFLVDELVNHLPANVDRDRLVFPASAGGPLRGTNWRRRVWRQAVDSSVGSPLRFHDLRHTHVAFLIAAGEHPKVISSRLGHMSVRTVLDRYGHLLEGLDQGAAEALQHARTDSLAASPRPGHAAAGFRVVP